MDKTRKMPSKYKPLLYTTTIRNPERYKDFMHVLLKYNGVVLNDQSVESIEKDLFRVGLYRPMSQCASIKNKWKSADKGDVALYALTDEETDYLYKNNPQKHKEAGFPEGWLSRFDTQFKLMKILGFVFYGLGQKIEFSDAGRILANSVSIIIEGEIIKKRDNQPSSRATCVFKCIFSSSERQPLHSGAKQEYPPHYASTGNKVAQR